MFPTDNAWNRDVSWDPVDPHSADYLAFMGAGWLKLHPSFGGPYGQPVLVVPADQERVTMTFRYADSDPGPYPFPANVPIQAAADGHVSVLQSGDCKLDETYLTYAEGGGGFYADSGAVFDLRSGQSRPDGWTSATAAGLPILPALARYDEAVEQGEIRHALAFVVGATAHAYTAPATHSAGGSWDAYAPPMGLRVRLKADFDLSGYYGGSLAILRAMQTYGMLLTDNDVGQFWAVNGTMDPRWSIEDLNQIKQVPASAFEVVKLGAIQQGP
jgi:hypothetical protein